MCAPGRGPVGGDGGRALSPPLLLFIGSLTTARTAAAPPLFHVCRASRHYLPPPRSVIRCQSGLRLGGRGIKAGPRRALEGVRRGGGRAGAGRGALLSSSGHQPCVPLQSWEGFRQPRGVAGRRGLEGVWGLGMASGNDLEGVVLQDSDYQFGGRPGMAF